MKCSSAFDFGGHEHIPTFLFPSSPAADDEDVYLNASLPLIKVDISHFVCFMRGICMLQKGIVQFMSCLCLLLTDRDIMHPCLHPNDVVRAFTQIQNDVTRFDFVVFMSLIKNPPDHFL